MLIILLLLLNCNKCNKGGKNDVYDDKLLTNDEEGGEKLQSLDARKGGGWEKKWNFYYLKILVMIYFLQKYEQFNYSLTSCTRYSIYCTVLWTYPFIVIIN